jgi:hypothetical protein
MIHEAAHPRAFQTHVRSGTPVTRAAVEALDERVWGRPTGRGATPLDFPVSGSAQHYVAVSSVPPRERAPNPGGLTITAVA